MPQCRRWWERARCLLGKGASPRPAVSPCPRKEPCGEFPRHPPGMPWGSPQRADVMQVTAGALVGLSSPTYRRKLSSSFANPPPEPYRWLMFIEVFYLELISLKSVLTLAKIPVPSCTRLSAPFSSQRFSPILLQESSREMHRAGRLKM